MNKGNCRDPNSVRNIWAEGDSFQYLPENYVGRKRQLETLLATADGIRKASELRLGIGADPKSVEFLVVWTSDHALSFPPSSSTRRNLGNASYDVFPFSFRAN